MTNELRYKIARLKANKKYRFEHIEGFSRDLIIEGEDIDEWGCPTMYFGDIGLEMNQYRDTYSRDDYIGTYYRIYIDDNGEWNTDTSDFYDCGLGLKDLKEEDWKEKLENDMCEVMIWLLEDNGIQI